MQDKNDITKRRDEVTSEKLYLNGALALAVSGLGTAVLCLLSVLLDVTSPALCVFFAIILYVALSLFIILRLRYKARHSFKPGGNVPDSILREGVINMDFPMLICDKTSGNVIWYNKATFPLSGGDSLFGKSYTSVFTVVEEGDDTSPEVVSCNGRYYTLWKKSITSGGKDFVIVAPHDITDLRQALEKYDAAEAVVMYIMADNLDEMADHEKEKYRGASAEIARTLSEWAESLGCVLKEYERDKYLCVLDMSMHRANIQNRFEILDKVRNIRVRHTTVPVTVSVGVATMHGKIGQKEKAARQALELALQRGGDQVVVKGDDYTDFYGGRTRTAQKRTRVRTRVFANELLMKMSAASSVMIMGHRFADFDCFGAAVGIARLAMLCGVPVHILSDYSDRGVDSCRKIMAGEKQYDGVFTDKVTALDLVDSDMLLVIVDVNNMDLVESPELADRCENVVVIDHHRKTAEFEREPVMSYIEPSCAATCEIVAEMLEMCLPEGTLTTAEADIMLAGITLDTKHFTKNTGTRTFGAALYLRGAGADPASVEELFRTSLEDFVDEAKFRRNVEIYRGKYAIALGEGECDSSDRVAAAKAADKLLTVDGVRASFAMIMLDGKAHISARSTEQINVQLILEKFGGGGHFDSAGAQVAVADLEEARELLHRAIDEYVAQ